MNRREFLMTPTAAGIAAAPLAASQASTSQRTRLRFRQVHLDFHTSEQVRDIGSQFDPEEFVSTLKRASAGTWSARKWHSGTCHAT